jgi:hypothetical protein
VGLIRSLFWVVLFVFFTFSFVVLFEYGTTDFVAGFQKEFARVTKYVQSATQPAKKKKSDAP